MIEKMKKELLDIACNKLFNLVGVEHDIIENIINDMDFELVDDSLKSKVLFKIIPVIKKTGIDISFSEICLAIVDELKKQFKVFGYIGDDKWFNDIEIVGNGILLLKTNSQFYDQIVSEIISESKFENDFKTDYKTVVVDYSSPNIAKEMHIGHLRSTVLGDAIANLYEFLGHNVIRMNHIGDWGTQFGMILALIQEDDLNINQLSDIESVYVRAKEKFESDDEFKNKSLSSIKKLQLGDPESIAIWNKFREISINHCMEMYSEMNINLGLNDVFGESFYIDKVDDVINELLDRKIAVIDNGAVCLYLKSCQKNKEGSKTPFIIRKEDGAYLYSTNDLAAIKYRYETFNPDEIIYVVDNRQKLHFNMLFDAFNCLIQDNNVKLSHIGFGTINGEDGKPFKSRDGNVIKLAEVISIVKKKAMEVTSAKNPDWSSERVLAVSDKIAIGSMKYYDLIRNRNTDYNFNLDAMFDFNGNTAVYLLYSLTRIKSIFRKLSIDPYTIIGNSEFSDVLFNSDYEFKLIKQIYEFNNIIKSVESTKNINILCDYLFNLSKIFNSFYANCNVIGDGGSVNKSRIALSAITMGCFTSCFKILGIETVDEI